MDRLSIIDPSMQSRKSGPGSSPGSVLLQHFLRSPEIECQVIRLGLRVRTVSVC